MDHQPIVTSADMFVTVFADVPQTAPPLPQPHAAAPNERFFPERIETHYTRGLFPADAPWSATFVRIAGPVRRVDGTPGDVEIRAVYAPSDPGLPAWAAEFVAAMLPEADDADADVDADRYRWGGTR